MTDAAAMEVNEEATKRLKEDPKTVKFLAWCDKHGVVRDSLDWPVAFGPRGDIVGVAAKKDIGLNEAYVYVPVNICINEEQFKRSWIGELYEKEYENIKEEQIYFHQFLLILFLSYQLSIAHRSFWAPYLDVVGDADLPYFWPEHELAMIQDRQLRQDLASEAEIVLEDYEYAFEMIKKYPGLVNPDKFTLDVFKRAHMLVTTRSFGWNLPYNMLAPYADMINHHCVNSYHQLFNCRLHKHLLRTKRLGEARQAPDLKPKERNYYITDRKKTNFFKHFKEDDDEEAHKEAVELSAQRSENLGYDVCRYYKKLTFRDEIEAVKAEEFLNDEKYKNMHIWDLKYLSTSDEDDGMSSAEESEDDEEDKSDKDAIKEDSDEDDDDDSDSEDELEKLAKTYNKPRAVRTVREAPMLPGEEEEEGKVSEKSEPEIPEIPEKPVAMPIQAMAKDMFKAKVSNQGEHVPAIARKLKALPVQPSREGAVLGDDG